MQWIQVLLVKHVIVKTVFLIHVNIYIQQSQRQQIPCLVVHLFLFYKLNIPYLDYLLLCNFSISKGRACVFCLRSVIMVCVGYIILLNSCFMLLMPLCGKYSSHILDYQVMLHIACCMVYEEYCRIISLVNGQLEVLLFLD